MTSHRPIPAAEAIAIHLLDYTIPDFQMVRHYVETATANSPHDVQIAAEKLTEKLVKKVEELSANKATAYQCHEEEIGKILPVKEREGMSVEVFGDAKPLVLKAWRSACEHKRNFKSRAQELEELQRVAGFIC
jgi:hypothetical protein